VTIPPREIPDYTDNDKYKLSSVLEIIINDYGEKNLDLATGYFRPNVWEAVGVLFNRLEHMRLMIGSEPALVQDRAGLNLHHFYQKQLKHDLEKAAFTPNILGYIDDLIAFLKRDTVEVRIFDDPFLHAKAYIFDRHVIVGSSNLTFPGITGNSELNLVHKSGWMPKNLRNDWFNPFWQRSKPYKDILIETLEKSKFGAHPYTPFEVMLKVLFENYQETLVANDPSNNNVIELASFQEEGFRVAKRLLDQYGGVMIADAVGLGKTYMGLSILEEFAVNRRSKNHVPRALVICPAQLRDTVWQPNLERYSIAATIVTMEELGRSDFPWKRYTDCDVVVIDESHNFRNRAAARYQNLMRVLAAGKTNKYITLLTATPVNNSIIDLYHQIKLLARGREDLYREQGITHLERFFKQVIQGRAEFSELVEFTMVRRSRRDVKRRQQQGERIVINNQEVHFPQRSLHRVDYSLFDQLGGFYDGFIDRIERLNLVAYNLERYKKKNQNEQEVRQREALAGIFKTNFLKRLESSIKAFLVSVRNQQHFQERFQEFFTSDPPRLIDAGTSRKIEQVLRLLDIEEDAGVLAQRYGDLLEALPVVQRLDYDVSAMERDIRQDVDALEWMADTANALLNTTNDAGGDSKLKAIKNCLLEARMIGQKIIIFTYFADTAQYLYDGLVRDPVFMAAAGQPAVAVITGSIAAKERSRLIERFAPRNRRRLSGDDSEVPSGEQIQMLISTDVLSEGQNLQDAGLLMNADLHWNPVRMIQRAGRIDRLGSNFEQLEIHNVFPEAGLERLLGLVGRLRQRISDIDRTVGLDASVLGEAISDRSLEELQRLRTGDARIIDELEAKSELASDDDMRLPLVEALFRFGRDLIEDLPLGIHSAKAISQAPSQAKAVFIALKVRERVVWRVYPLVAPGEAVPAPQETSKRRIFDLIQASTETPRAENPTAISIFPYLERAIQDILTESKRQERNKAFKLPLEGLAKKLHERLSDLMAQNLDPSTRSRLLRAIEDGQLAAFKTDADFKRIVELPNLADIVLEMEAFLIENRITVAPDPTITAKTIKENDITLIAYEWLV
jgi:superfamily II DNA or RNA helicase